MKAKRIRLSLLDIYLGTICLFPISTMLVDGTIWNKLMFAIIFAVHICLLLSESIKRRTFLILVFLVLHYFYVIIKTNFPLANSNLLFYYPFFIMYTLYMSDHTYEVMEWFVENKKYIQGIALIWTILVGVSILLPSSYYIKEGGAYYFGSFAGSIFRLGPAAVFIQTLVLMMQIIYKERKAILYMIIPMYSFLMGSARTYLVIGFCLFVISWYIFCKKKAWFWGTVIPLFAVVLFLVSISSMGQKILYTLDENQYGDFWFRITSSRNVIWAENLEAWLETGIIGKIFGNGLGFSYDTTRHWAHNDFIEIMCSFGIVGLTQYLYVMRVLSRTTIKSVKMPFFIRTCATMVWFFNAFFNMHYVYFCAMLSFPLLTMVLYIYFNQNSQEKKWRDERIYG